MVHINILLAELNWSLFPNIDTVLKIKWKVFMNWGNGITLCSMPTSKIVFDLDTILLNLKYKKLSVLIYFI